MFKGRLFSVLGLVMSVLFFNGLASPVRAENRVVAWGAGTTVDENSLNNYGQSIVPPGLTNAICAAAGWRHGLAINADGTVASWGDDSQGQYDFFSERTNNYVAIAARDLHSLALHADGTVESV